MALGNALSAKLSDVFRSLGAGFISTAGRYLGGAHSYTGCDPNQHKNLLTL